MNMTNKEFIQHLDEREIAAFTFEELQKIANEILLEPLNLKNQMTMKGIFYETNEIIGNVFEGSNIEWENKFQFILDKWIQKNEHFSDSEFM
jgi:hypothetical protein